MNINLWDIAMVAYNLGGESMLRRAITIPQDKVKKVCELRGTSFAQAILERDQFVNDFVDFFKTCMDIT